MQPRQISAQPFLRSTQNMLSMFNMLFINIRYQICSASTCKISISELIVPSVFCQDENGELLPVSALIQVRINPARKAKKAVWLL